MRHHCYLLAILALSLWQSPVTAVLARKRPGKGIKANISKINPFAKKPPTPLESLTNAVQGLHKPNDKKKDNNSSLTKHTVQNLLAGLASAIALIPEASTFAMTAGLHPLVGLGSTVVMALTSGSLGGRPGLVSGATATVSMILKPLMASGDHLVVSLAVLMAGLFQIGLGCTKCARYVRVVPQPVMLGFVNGLAIKVVLAQIPHFQHPHGVWLQGEALKWHSLLVLASALIIETLPKLTTAVPSPLAALGLAAVVAEKWNLPVPKLVDLVGPEAFEGGFNTLKQALFPFAGIPSFGRVLNRQSLAMALPVALEMAVVGLLQSLLALQIIDSKTHTRGRNTQETFAQGLGNVISGAMGGMGGSALLGQSLVNVNSGGTGRLSSISVAVFVALGITFCAPLIGGLPVAALVGLMLTVAQHTFHWRLLGNIVKGHLPWVDLFIIVSVCGTTAFGSMVTAVGLGVLASALRFAWQASCNMSTQESGTYHNRIIRVAGPLFFGSTTTFDNLCTPSAKDREVAAKHRARLAKRKAASKTTTTNEPAVFSTGRETIIDFSESRVWDHSAVMAIESLAEQYHELGVKLRLRRLSPDSREKLLESSDIGKLSTVLEVDQQNDPSYLVGDDPSTSSRTKPLLQPPKPPKSSASDPSSYTIMGML